MTNMTQKLRTIVQENWPVFAAFAALAALTLGLLLFKINTLLPGYSAQEIATYNAATSLSELVKSPVNAPYYVLVHFLQYLTPHNLLAVRLASILVGAITALIFAILMLRWHGIRTAFVGTLLFITSAWFLHAARYGSPDVMFLAFLSLAACGVWLHEKQASLAVLIGLVLSAVLLYTPGMAWFLAFGLFLQWPIIDKAFKKNPGSVTLGSALFVAILAPLIWFFFKHPHEITHWLGLPQHIWTDILEVLRGIINVPLAIFVRAPADNPVAWVGRLPILNVFAVTMFVSGCYVYAKKVRLARTRMFLALGILGSLVIGISQGAIPIAPLIPFVFAVVAAGIGYVTDVWFKVFPRNPLAQSIGVSLLAGVIILACVYETGSYFMTWPGTQATQDLFTTTQL